MSATAAAEDVPRAANCASQELSVAICRSRLPVDCSMSASVWPEATYRSSFSVTSSSRTSSRSMRGSLSAGDLELFDALRHGPCPCNARRRRQLDRGQKEAEDPRLHGILDRMPKERWANDFCRICGRLWMQDDAVGKPIASRRAIIELTGSSPSSCC